MARLDLPDPRRDEDDEPGALPSADYRARQRLAGRAERAKIVFAAAVAQGKGGLLADRVIAAYGDIPVELLYTLNRARPLTKNDRLRVDVDMPEEG